MKKVLVISLILLCFGCSKEKEKANLEVSCANTVSTIEVSEGNTISCKLLDNTYELKINKITKDKIELENNQYGLTDDNNLVKKTKTFTLKDELRLKTQTTDKVDYLVLKRK